MSNLYSKSRQYLRRVVESFSKPERGIFIFLGLVLAVGTIGVAYKVNQAFTVEVPLYGGEYKEGILGTPRFINPVLARTDADRDLTRLVFSGLMRQVANGSLKPDLARGYEISEDGLTYTFFLRDNIVFHDGNPITPSDIIFTIDLIQNNLTESPEASRWAGVKAEAPNSHTVIFTLTEPFAGFLANTTLGIVPQHLWQGLAADQLSFSSLNNEPVGSGPFKVSKIKQTKAGIPTEYKLSAFRRYAHGKPSVKTITLRFYPNESELIDAFSRQSINGMGAVSPQNLVDLDYEILESSPLPRLFGLFFNRTSNVALQDKAVRQAINLIIDREELISTVLYGQGTAIYGPLPVHQASTDLPDEDGVEILDNAGWTLNDEGLRTKRGRTLQFSISTSDTLELRQAAEVIQATLVRYGFDVNLRVFDIGNLEEEVIRNRNFDALLFGQVLNHDTDLYAFWHSSQINSPGINISGYSNTEVDKALEASLSETNTAEREKLYQTIATEVNDDLPAIFLYSPNYVYVTNERINNFDLGRLTNGQDRFHDVHTWYVKTEKVWTMFE